MKRYFSTTSVLALFLLGCSKGSGSGHTDPEGTGSELESGDADTLKVLEDTGTGKKLDSAALRPAR